jgi:hypothetical protein
MWTACPLHTIIFYDATPSPEYSNGPTMKKPLGSTLSPLLEKLGVVDALKHDDNAKWFVT